MPRVTNQQYLTRRDQLADIWQELKYTYYYLTSDEQRALHDYYRPAEKLTDPQALALRENIGMFRPTLPQVAGRAYAKLVGIYAGSIKVPAPETVHVAAGHAHTRSHSISVRAVLRPKPDTERIIRALMSIKPEVHESLHKQMEDEKPDD